jgi:hypothetical protein
MSLSSGMFENRVPENDDNQHQGGRYQATTTYHERVAALQVRRRSESISGSVQ